MDTTIEKAPKCAPINEACQFSSPPITVEEFRAQCIASVGEERFAGQLVAEGDHVRSLAAMMGIEEGTVEELEDVCNPDNFKCEYDDTFDYMKLRVYKDYPNNVPLNAARLVRKGLRKAEEFKYIPCFPNGKEGPSSIVSDVNVERKLVPNDEVVLSVSIYSPEQRKRNQEYLVLPDQYLTELRDVIKCSGDRQIAGEFSHNPDLKHAKTAKELYPSSFFFIDNTFYTDMRDPLNRDYSSTIIDWAKSSERFTLPGLGYFEKNRMEETQFKDLTIRLGYPYLYCHLGNCEHIIIFNDMRLRTEMDPAYVSSYPFPLLIAKPNRRKCSICNIHLVKWMTRGSQMAFEDPSFFCNRCFDYLHYTADGKKSEQDFKAYPYYEKEI